MNSSTGSLSGVTAKGSPLPRTLVWSSVSLYFDTFITHFFNNVPDRCCFRRSLVVVSLFNLFTCRHFEFSNYLSRTLVKCENVYLLTLLDNSSLISRIISSFRSCNLPNLMSLAICVFIPYFIFKLGDVTPSSRHRKENTKWFLYRAIFLSCDSISRIFRTVFCPYSRLIFVKMFIKLVYIERGRTCRPRIPDEGRRWQSKR